jgi:hypothetical protein
MGQGYPFGIVGLWTEPYGEGTGTMFLRARRFNQEQKVVPDGHSNSWKQSATVLGNGSQPGDVTKRLFVGSQGGLSIGRGD